MKERKQFNFYRSFADIANQLPKKYRLEFYEAIINHQLVGATPVFSGVLAVAWAGVKHSLEKQLTGYVIATSELTPSGGGSGGDPLVPSDIPPKQVLKNKNKNKDKEKGEVKELNESIHIDTPTLPVVDFSTTPRKKNEVYELFQEWYQNEYGLEYQMAKKDWVGIAKMSEYLNNLAAQTSSDTNTLFLAIFSRYKTLPRFFQENVSPSFIASRMNEILAILKGAKNAEQKNDKAASVRAIFEGL
jgi:hypothetical protein